MSGLLGTQPFHRHSPAIRLRSMSATRAPIPTLPAAVTSPAVPPPTTMISYINPRSDRVTVAHSALAAASHGLCEEFQGDRARLRSHAGTTPRGAGLVG